MKEKLIKLLKTLAQEAVKLDGPKQGIYPETVEECIDDDLKYRVGVYEVLKKFRSSRPWVGTMEEMQHKFKMLNEDLSEIYKMKTPQLVFVDRFPTGSCCIQNSKPPVIIIEPEQDSRYSVVCYLHEFAHALGKGEKDACKWSINLFKRIFPSSYEALDHKGHMLVRKKSENRKIAKGS